VTEFGNLLDWRSESVIAVYEAHANNACPVRQKSFNVFHIESVTASVFDESSYDAALP
jgi:hypothetical protein